MASWIRWRVLDVAVVLALALALARMTGDLAGWIGGRVLA